ncbi:neuferricin [Hypanus sabinus]|uniref:neuferricin n=1 Tax=Hypanus sabinus TaxID=79690 RepID=UPI0028C42F88|nr:neuferricin [Hypanus sabinus]XP_059828929.1 neuferricin [Hypanus sabinus]
MPQTLVLCAAAAAALLIPSDVWRLLSCGLAGWFGPVNNVSTSRIFSKAELSRYTGGKGSPGLYLAVLGQVFDVDRGRRHYGPGGSYHFFTGRDACRAFVSGDFTEPGLIDDVSGLSPTEMLSLHEWLTFYKREYIFKGKLVGTYYDHNGEPTRALIDAELVTEQGRKLKAELEVENKVFPPCNSEWTSTKGGRVWCSTHSGGIKRNWVGVPRKLYKIGSKNYRCVCVRTDGPASNQPNSVHNRRDLDNPALAEYPGCGSVSDSCAIVEE